LSLGFFKFFWEGLWGNIGVPIFVGYSLFITMFLKKIKGVPTWSSPLLFTGCKWGSSSRLPLCAFMFSSLACL
jgi:hypothetical protein